MRSGRPIPAAILNAPTINAFEQFYFSAYMELTTERRYEGGAIPWSAVNEYADVHKITWLRETFIDIILTMDVEWLMLMAKKRKRAEPPKPKSKR